MMLGLLLLIICAIACMIGLIICGLGLIYVAFEFSDIWEQILLILCGIILIIIAIGSMIMVIAPSILIDFFRQEVGP